MSDAPKMKVYTDYTINGSTGIIQVEALSYDRNKYVTVRYGNIIDEIKSGYLYLDPGLQHFIGQRRLYALPMEPGEKPRTRRQVHAELMINRRRHKTTYVLYLGEEKYVHDQLGDALRHFGRVFRQRDCWLMKKSETKNCWSSEAVVESENGELIIPVRCGRASIAIFHTRHYRVAVSQQRDTGKSSS